MALSVLCLAVFMVAVDGTVVGAAVPSIAEQLHPGYNQVLWIGMLWNRWDKIAADVRDGVHNAMWAVQD